MVGRCPACPGVNHCISGDGPQCNDSTVVCLGEAPGRDEQRRQQVFIGKTGRELNEHYLLLAGLRRGQNVYVTNAIKCLPVGAGGKLDMKQEKDRQLLESCAGHHLPGEISGAKLIVAMGAFACAAIDPAINLELHHGIPLNTAWGTVFPMLHPAGGIHEPKKMLTIRTDWIRLGKYLKGRLPVAEDQWAGREEYGVIESAGHLESVLSGREDLPLANDTETTSTSQPFCLSMSVQPGTGWLLPSSNAELLGAYQDYLHRWAGPILFHNWIFDRQVTRRMGLRYPEKLIKDTMMMAYHLGNVPQGLKALSYRELGMEMQDFDDMVMPYSRPRAIRYIRDCLAEDEWPKPEPLLYRTPEGKWKMKKPHGMRTKFKTFFTYLAKNPDGKDVYGAWDNWEDSHALIQEKMGPFPYKCITHAWEDNPAAVTHYACRDADATLRLYPLLLKATKRMRKCLQEKWFD